MTRRSCVVTGAASGIGAGIAARLTAEGWAVVGLDLVEAPDQPFATVVGDVADRDAHRRAAAVASQLGRPAGWVNCAGYNVLGTVADLSEADLRRGVEVNLLGVFHGCAEAATAFLDQPEAGRDAAIVNISSIQASVGLRNFAAYAMCKGGIEALTRQVATEYVAQGIRCNAVAPGLITSPMGDALLAQAADPEALLRSWDALTPIGRQGTPADIAAAVAFLLDGAESGFITGQVLAVNGGATIVARGQ
jgi:NAD(P)-dependent dehydrogenase (short-subunit alcohol dehydrogenase family)